jgi:hypothetical protein
MLRKLTDTLCVALLLLMSFRAMAEEPLFGWVYTTDLLPDGKYEAAQWLTERDGKPVGQYDVVEGRTEFEYGLSDRLQVAAYLNYEWADAYHDNAITGATLPPATLANLNVGPNQRLDTTRLTAVSLEGIYRVLSPYLDPIGLALYLRPSVGPQFREVEARVILQKNFIDDRFVVAFNIGDTADWRDIPNGPSGDGTGFNRTWDDDSTFAFGLASSYRFATGWSAGVELQNERGYAAENPFDAAQRTSVAYYLGPTLHYANGHMFATLNYLTQLALASDYAHTNPDFDVDGRNYAAGNERFRLRLKFGWYF